MQNYFVSLSKFFLITYNIVMSKFNNLKIKTRLNIFQNLVIVIVFVSLGLYIVTSQTKSVLKETDERMNEQLDNMSEEIEMQIADNQEKVNLSLNLAHQIFYLSDKITELTEKTSLKAINQITKEETTVELNKWKYKDKVIQENNEFVDQLKELKVETTTLFQKIDEGFVRISTTVTKENGERAIGTYIPNESPVIQTILKGETYKGRAYVVKDWFLTAYEPILIDNQIKGILYVGINEKNMTSLKENFSKRVFYETGFSFLFDIKGKIIIHPKDEGKVLSDNIIIKTIINSPDKTGKIKLNINKSNKFFYYKYSEPIESYITIQIDENKIFSKVEKISIAIIISFLISIFLILLINYILSNSIIKALEKGVKFTNQIANGNLKAKIDVEWKDEIGILSNSLNIMAMRICNIVKQINENAENINLAGRQLKSASQNISQGASEQASSTEEMAAAIEEMASTISRNSENAQLTQSISQIASQNIIEVSKAVDKSNEEVKEIAYKIAIINDIAFQTNILALNAAVEAARAGEHGKGFAVVAAEVRKLAEKSRNAADKITDLIKNNVTQTQQSKLLLDKLIPEVKRTNGLVAEIAESSYQQNIGAMQVSSSIQQLNIVVQQNASSAEEMASTAEELVNQANKLIEAISFFKNNSI